MGMQERLQLALGSAAAIQALHDHRMAHNDIAARNFLSYKKDNLPYVMVCDLGLARDLNGEDDQRILPDSMAPELDEDSLLYTGEITCRSDIYSFGLLLLELLGCKDPTQKTKIPNLPHLPDGYRALVEECRQPRWQNRPVDMAHVHSRLEGGKGVVLDNVSRLWL
jgi:serine/threonine protein kinase